MIEDPFIVESGSNFDNRSRHVVFCIKGWIIKKKSRVRDITPKKLREFGYCIYDILGDVEQHDIWRDSISWSNHFDIILII